MANFREHSKTNWVSNNNPDKATNEEINVGSLQRIADATEKMAGNYTALQNDRDLYRRRYNEKKEEVYRLLNRIRSLKGANTKLRKRLGL